MAVSSANHLASIIFLFFILSFSSIGHACDEGCLTEKVETLRLQETVSAVTIGDVNNDGLPDIVTVGGDWNDAIHIYFQGSEHRFKLAESFYFPEGQQGDSIGLGDFNSDGNVDIVVTAAYGIRILYRNSLGQFSTNQYIQINSDYKLRVGDFNADGRDDVAVIGWNNQQLRDI